MNRMEKVLLLAWICWMAIMTGLMLLLLRDDPVGPLACPLLVATTMVDENSGRKQTALANNDKLSLFTSLKER